MEPEMSTKKRRRRAGRWTRSRRGSSSMRSSTASPPARRRPRCRCAVRRTAASHATSLGLPRMATGRTYLPRKGCSHIRERARLRRPRWKLSRACSPNVKTLVAMSSIVAAGSSEKSPRSKIPRAQVGLPGRSPPRATASGSPPRAAPGSIGSWRCSRSALGPPRPVSPGLFLRDPPSPGPRGPARAAPPS